MFHISPVKYHMSSCKLKQNIKQNMGQVHEAAQAYTQTTVGKSPEAAAAAKVPGTNNDEGDLYLVNPDGQFIASYGVTLCHSWLDFILLNMQEEYSVLCRQAYFNTLLLGTFHSSCPNKHHEMTSPAWLGIVFVVRCKLTPLCTGQCIGNKDII